MDAAAKSGRVDAMDGISEHLNRKILIRSFATSSSAPAFYCIRSRDFGECI